MWCFLYVVINVMKMSDSPLSDTPTDLDHSYGHDEPLLPPLQPQSTPILSSQISVRLQPPHGINCHYRHQSYLQRGCTVGNCLIPSHQVSKLYVCNKAVNTRHSHKHWHNHRLAIFGGTILKGIQVFHMLLKMILSYHQAQPRLAVHPCFSSHAQKPIHSPTTH